MLQLFSGRLGQLIEWNLTHEEVVTVRLLKRAYPLGTFSIDDYAKDGGEELLPRCNVFLLQILNNSIGIRLKNAVHLGKKLLAAIFSVILYLQIQVRHFSKNL